MKKIIILFFLLFISLFSQTPIWEAAGNLGTLNSSYYSRSNIINARDTLFVISDNNAGTGGGYLWRYSFIANTWSNPVNTGFGFSSYPTLNPSILFTKNNVLYNYYGSDDYNVYIRGFRTNHSLFVSALGAANKVYLRPIITGSLFKDSLIFFTAGYGYSGFDNVYLTKYDSLSNTWSYQAIPELYQHNSPYSRDNQVVLGSFYIKDTLYVTTQIDSSDILIDRFPLKVWKRDPATYTWTNIKSFTNILSNPVIQQYDNSTVYFLLSGRKDSTIRVWNEGIWKFDGDTWVRYTHPVDTTFYSSMYVSDYGEIFVGTSSKYNSTQNYIWRYINGIWQNGGRIEYSTGLYLGNGNIIRYNGYIFCMPSLDQYGVYSKSYSEQGGNRVFRTDDFDAIKITSPTTEGNVYLSNSTYSLGYMSTHPCTLSVYFSSDNGINWSSEGTTIATAGNNVYDFTIPTVSSTLCLLKITTTSILGNTLVDSTKKFTVYSSGTISITSVSPSSGNTGSVIDIVFNSVNVDSVNIYYSPISSFDLEYLISKVIVANIPDEIIETTYHWALTVDVYGSFYIKVEEYRDTIIYSIPQVTVKGLGTRAGAGNGYLCQSHSNVGTFLESYTKFDVSCGWTQPPHQYITTWIIGDGNNMSITRYTNTYNHPYTGAHYTKYADIVVGANSFNPASPYFYTNMGTSINVDGRRYHISASGKYHYLYCDDLINGIDSMLIADISPLYIEYYGSWGFGTTFLNETASLMEYDIDIGSLISNAPYENPIEWETINPVGFKKAIIIGNTGGYLNTYYFIPIFYPNSSSPLVYDTWGVDDGSKIEVTSVRTYFRGIHPKIWKYGHRDGKP